MSRLAGWPVRLGGLLVALILGEAACGHGSSLGGVSRRERLEQLLRARHEDLLARNPAAVAEQLARMARSSFAYFRGSIGLLPEEPSRFVSAAAGQLAVVGDPHPENIGTFRTPRGERVVDFNDFDLAGHGSYVSDLRRLALGLWLAADMADLGRRPRSRTVEEMCEGYLAEIQALGRGGPPFRLRAEAAFGGDIGSILADEDDKDAREGAEVPRAERAMVEAAMVSYRVTLLQPDAYPVSALAVKNVTRSSAGISSLRLLRFRARLEGPTPADDDDWWLELKESEARPGATAEVLVRLQRELQEFPDQDPLLGWAHVAGRDFRVRGAGAEQRRLSVERMARRLKSPQWGKKDLRELAFETGRLLARAHARARGADGHPGLSTLVAAVGEGRGLTAETVAVTARAAATVESDLDHLRALIKEKGPLLGWQSSERQRAGQ